jgi:predicted RNA binding protein YcfA (HicA-like mRNA interferase family)
MQKIKDRKTFLKIIRKAGYVLVRNRGHATYKNEEVDFSIAVPTGKKFSIPLHNRLLKNIRQAKLDKNNKG